MPILTILQELVFLRGITQEQIIALTPDQLTTLNRPNISRLLNAGKITFGQAIALTREQSITLDCPALFLFMYQEKIPLEQAIALTTDQLRALNNIGIPALLFYKSITFEQAVALTTDQAQILNHAGVCQLIINGTITFEQAIGLTIDQANVLNHAGVFQLVTGYTLTIQLEEAAECAVLATDQEQGDILDDDYIDYNEDFIPNRIITFEQAVGLTVDQANIFNNEGVLMLLINRTITFEQAAGLHPQQVRALQLQGMGLVRRLLNGELTMQQIMAPDAIQHIQINRRQSTHTASVHRSTSASALKLIASYPAIKAIEQLNEIISKISEEISKLKDGNLQNEAAKRCITRLTADDYTFTDPSSEISIRQLLALSWEAIHDERRREGKLQDAMRRFIEGLYEIQREYNISETGVDLGASNDSPACTGGTFNKLIEKLVGIHPDAEIDFITPKLAGLKQPLVIKEELRNYLANKANPATASELTQFTRLIEHIEHGGIDVIWDDIKDLVSERMFNEFGVLFENKQDPKFIDFIDAGRDIVLKQLPCFQKEISASTGYQQYCSAILYSNIRFFSLFNDLNERSDDKSLKKP